MRLVHDSKPRLDPAPSARPRVLALMALVAATYALELWVVRSPAFAARPRLVGGAVTVDLALGVPLLYGWTLVRPRIVPASTLLPALALSLLGAWLVLPPAGRDVVSAMRLLIVPLEVGAVGWGVWRARQALRAAAARERLELDVAGAIERATMATLGPGLPARLVATEVATVYHAFAPRTPPALAARDPRVFTHRDASSTSLVWGFALVLLVEGVAGHLWLASSHPTLALVHGVLAVYSLVWLAGLHRAMRRRVTVLADDVLTLRAGLRLTARVPVSAIASVVEPSWRERPERARDYADAASPVDVNVLLTFTQPVEVTVAFGLRRRVTRVGLRLDEPARFVAAVRDAAGRAGTSRAGTSCAGTSVDRARD